MKIRNRYDASVPTVVGAVERKKPVFVDDARYLRQLTTQPIKWALPGPMTMIDTLYDAHYKSREKLAWEFAKILNQEARELEAAGVDIIQFDEPAFNVFFDEVNDWGIATLERAIEGLKCETAVHICYGYGIKANTDWKKTLGNEWRQYEEAFPKLQASNIDIISLECHNSRVPMDLLELIRGKKVMVGAIDVANHTVETAEEVADTLRKALQFVDADKLYPSTNCGMAPLPRHVAQGKLNALSAGRKSFVASWRRSNLTTHRRSPGSPVITRATRSDKDPSGCRTDLQTPPPYRTPPHAALRRNARLSPSWHGNRARNHRSVGTERLFRRIGYR